VKGIGYGKGFCLGTYPGKCMRFWTNLTTIETTIETNGLVQEAKLLSSCRMADSASQRQGIVLAAFGGKRGCCSRSVVVTVTVDDSQ
jgi:hypothetical protein